MSSSNMFDEIMNGFGSSFGSRFSSKGLGRNSERNKENEKKEPKKPSFDNFDLMTLPQAKPIFPVEQKPKRNSLEMIMGRFNPNNFMSSKESKTRENPELNMKRNLRKWRFTSSDGHKTSAMTKSRSAPRRSKKSGRQGRVRNYVMGVSEADKDSQIDLNSLLNGMQNGNNRFSSMVPENLEIVFKDQNGRIIGRNRKRNYAPEKRSRRIEDDRNRFLMRNEPKEEKPEQPESNNQKWEIGDMLVERKQPGNAGSRDYVNVEYQVSH